MRENDDPFSDPISKSNDLKDAGDFAGAYKILMEAVSFDLRCLDAHAHLGNFVFEHSPQEAVRHYEVGIQICELSLGDGFDGVLQWGLIGDRPFLRSGYASGVWSGLTRLSVLLTGCSGSTLRITRACDSLSRLSAQGMPGKLAERGRVKSKCLK